MPLKKDKDIQEHDDIVITITAEDISGIRKIQCLYDGVEIPLDETGQMFINDFEVRPHSVVIRAWDNFGNLRSYLLSFYVVETEVSGGGSVSVGGNTEDTESQTLIADRNGYATVYEYDKNGNRSAVRYANGIVITYKYDEVNRLVCEKALDKQGGIVA